MDGGWFGGNCWIDWRLGYAYFVDSTVRLIGDGPRGPYLVPTPLFLRRCGLRDPIYFESFNIWGLKVE